MATFICSGDSMPAHVKVSGVWREVKEIWVRSGGQWRRTWDGFVQNGGSRNFHHARTEVTIAGAASTDIAGLFGGEWTANRRKQLTVTGATGPLFIGSDFGGTLTIKINGDASVNGLGGYRGDGATGWGGKPGGTALETWYGDSSRLFLENYGWIRGGGGGGGRGGNGGGGAWEETIREPSGGFRQDGTQPGQGSHVRRRAGMGERYWVWGSNQIAVNFEDGLWQGSTYYSLGPAYHTDFFDTYYGIAREWKEWRYENGGFGGDGGWGAGWGQNRSNGANGGDAPHWSSGRGGRGGDGGDWGQAGGGGEHGWGGNNGSGTDGGGGGAAGAAVRGWGRFNIVSAGGIAGDRVNQ